MHSAYGQSISNGSYVGLEDYHYSSREHHHNFKWYHLTRLTIKDDSVWVEQDPIAIYKKDTMWSSSDGAFYYFEGRITTEGNQITMNLKMTNCDYSGVPIDSAYRKRWSNRIWNGQMTTGGLVVNGTYFRRSDQEAYRGPFKSNK